MKNQITSIPEELGQLSNLIVLDLSSNQITSIPEALGQLSNLEELCLSSNEINEKIPQAIRGLQKLTKLELSYMNRKNPTSDQRIGEANKARSQ